MQILLIIKIILAIYLSIGTLYLLVLAITYFICKESKAGESVPQNRFAIIVPAHNEELLIGKLCQSLLQIEYPKECFAIYVVADNCTDTTTEICRRYSVKVLERHDPQNRGKGQAMAWGLKEILLDEFDAVLMVDADNVVNSAILKELNKHINKGEQAIQCFNAVGNRDDSWFTQLLFVSRTIGNLLYHESKYRLGLSSYLMGNGICFKTELLRGRGWTAFSAGEDWEYYAQLIESGIQVGFASRALVFHQESRSLNQATSQRLRWSKGRFSIARTFGFRLFWNGLRQRNWIALDASLPLIFPNYSLQINLTLLGLALSFLPSPTAGKLFFPFIFSGLLTGQFMLFLAGAFIAGSPLKIFRAVLYAPFFLVWKGVIDLLCVSGIYRGKKWVRTRRHQSS